MYIRRSCTVRTADFFFSIYAHYNPQMYRVFSKKIQPLCDKTLSLSTIAANVKLVIVNVSRKNFVFP